MSAVQCEKFVRNAWKKELCSNCFKGKEEHPEKPDRVHHVPVKLPDPPEHGILKGSKQTPSKPNKVAFPETEFEVIGYGGDDVYSDDDDLPVFQEKQTHDEPDTEHDREIQRLTKTNTEFNSVPTNLKQSTPAEPVRLGQKNRDDQGKKTPLLVSVTPFGGPTPSSQSKIRTTNTTTLALDVNVKPEEPNQPKHDEGATPKENREANLLDIAEPAKVAEVGIRRSHPIDKNSKFRPQKELNDGVKNQLNLQTQQDNKVVSENKLNDKLTITASTKVANLLDKAKKKVNNLPVIGDANHFKFSSVNCKRPGDANKPVVLDMFKLGDETKKIEDTVDEKSLVDVPKHQYLTKISPTIVFETKKSDDTDRTLPSLGKTILSTVTNVSSLHRSSVLELKINKDANGASKADSAITETDSVSNVCSTNAQFCQDIAICDKLDNYSGIIEGEEVTVFSLEKGKLEMNAQTNDAANNKDKFEEEEEAQDVPPALPASPPPSTDPPTENSSVPIPSDYSDTFSPRVKSQMTLATIETQVPKTLATTDSQVLLPPSSEPQVPPPISDPQVSFLHQLTSGSKFKSREKPKVPAKPVSIASKKPQFRVFSPRPKSPSLETFLDLPHEPLSESLSDSSKKRPAPKPPSPKTEGATLRSALSSDDLLNMSHCSNSPLGNTSEVNIPVPRRSLSLSQDCLLDSGVSEMQGKKKNRGRFSLRKLLHIGKAKEGGKEGGRREYRIAAFENAPSPAPRLKLKPEIIHPLDLTGAQVEVMPSQRIIKTRRTSSSASSSSGEHRESDIPSDSSTSQSVSSSSNSTVDALVTLERVRKPPPPPRGQMFDQTDKPIRPPPPKSAATPERQPSLSSPPPKENCYANIGEVRTGLAPHKPVRTGSLREVDVVKKLVAASGTDDLHPKKHYWTGSLRGPPKCAPIAPPEDSGYESFDISLTTASSQTSSLTAEENLYECVQTPDNNTISSETCMLRNTRQSNYRSDRRSEGNVADPSHDYIKFRFLRSISMPYCASEAESDIYSPYSFCGSEMGEEDYEWSPTSGRFQKVSRLKMKKGRSIVHKNLEDNYGAVVVANHEALTQVVEQMHPGGVTSPLLRPLVSAHNLRWSDFTIVKESVGVFVDHRAFYPALWGVHAVTVCVAPAQSVGSLQGKPPFNFSPLTELHDLVPACFLNDTDSEDTTLIQCLISVLSRIQIEPIGIYSTSARNSHFSDELKKEVHFTLLQTINAFKTLQASGIEEAPRELSNVVVCREERDPYPRVCMLPNSTAETASLCSCLLTILEDLPSTELSSLLKTTLTAEKAVSLSQAKALLEFTLWGPTDITFSGCSRGGALQRWLDLERASVLHGLIRTRADLSVFEENHLLFLVHTNAKVLADASVLLDAQTADC